MTPSPRYQRSTPRAAPPRHARSTESSDAELLTAVRGGRTQAYGQLYERHRDAARKLAGVLTRHPTDADDLVADAFARVFSVLRRGGGPESAFRPYLLTALRHVCYDRARQQQRIELTEDMTRYEQPAYSDPAEDALDRSYAARAFARLPERWRMVLWHTEVEGQRPARVAPLLGLTPNAVAALAYRARERLRQMYLQEHLHAAPGPACRWTADRLGAHVRQGLPPRQRSRVDSHLAACPRCRQLLAELKALNGELPQVLGSLVLGAAAASYVAVTAPSPLARRVAALTEPLAAVRVRLVAGVANRRTAVARGARRLARRYGAGNLAAGAAVGAAVLAGVALFGLALTLEPVSASSGAQGTDSGAGAPVPVPAPQSPGANSSAPSASPTDREPEAGSGPDERRVAHVPAGRGVPPEATPTPDPPPSPTGGPEPSPEASPEPPPPLKVVVADVGTVSLAAGSTGSLPLEVTIPTAGTESAPPDGAQAGPVVLALTWPEGLRLEPDGQDAGQGWDCVAAADSAGARCERPAWPAGEARTARPVIAVDREVSGFVSVDATVAVGDRQGAAQVRVPVAPPAMTVAYADTGRHRLALTGNTWLSCDDRPGCWQGPVDNDHLA